MDGKRILLIVGGGIAAYKSLELIRLLARDGIATRVILTKAGAEFVTPLSVGALTSGTVFTDLFDRQAEHDVGHTFPRQRHQYAIVAKGVEVY